MENKSRMTLLDGKTLSKEKLSILKEKVSKLDRKLGIAIIKIGDNKESNIYINNFEFKYEKSDEELMNSLPSWVSSERDKAFPADFNASLDESIYKYNTNKEAIENYIQLQRCVLFQQKESYRHCFTSRSD